MGYEVNWFVPDKVLRVILVDEYTPILAQEVNQRVLDELDRRQSPMFLLLDVRAMQRPKFFQEIRATQTFMHHPKLRHIFVVSNDKIIRLSIVIIFNLSRASVRLYDTLMDADDAIKLQLRNSTYM